MAVNIRSKQFPEFDVRIDPETVYSRFSKYAKRFKDNHLKAYNITSPSTNITSTNNDHSVGCLWHSYGKNPVRLVVPKIAKPTNRIA